MFSGRIWEHQKRASLIGDGDARAACDKQVAEAALALLRLADDPDLWQRCSNAARELVAGHYSADSRDLQWRQLLQDLDRQFSDAPSNPYPIDSLRIGSLRRIAPSFHQEYKPPMARTATLRQTLRTTIARVKHRIKTAMGRPA